jgi:hypothetical protein
MRATLVFDLKGLSLSYDVVRNQRFGRANPPPASRFAAKAERQIMNDEVNATLARVYPPAWASGKFQSRQPADAISAFAIFMASRG